MLKFEEALLKILTEVKTLPSVKLPILRSLGLVLAEDIYSPEDIPHFNNSAMDGFAVMSDYVHNASKLTPVILNIGSEIPAGHASTASLKEKQAIKILTGAKIPEGADAVVAVEDTELAGDGSVRIFKQVEKGVNIRAKGENVKAGELIIKSGKILTPADIGMLASLGISKVSIIRKPTVAVLATGNEVVDINKILKEGKIRNSNSYSLYCQVLISGAVPVLIGIAKDTKKDLKEKIKKALKYDCVVSSGGVSVGEYDFVKDVIKELKGTINLWQVAIKPGKPIVFARIKQKVIFGLPGNPVSAMVTYDQFVKPSLYKMMGKTYEKRIIKAVLKNDYKKKTGRKEFVRVKVTLESDKYFAEITGPQGSGILKSMVLANGYMVLSEDTSFVKSGSIIDVELIDET